MRPVAPLRPYPAGSVRSAKRGTRGRIRARRDEPDGSSVSLERGLSSLVFSRRGDVCPELLQALLGGRDSGGA